MAPQKLTEEENFLKEQFKALHEAKAELSKFVANKKKLKLPNKKESQLPNKPTISSIKHLTPAPHSELTIIRSPSATIKPISSAEAAANTAKVKELLHKGILKLNVEKKTSFKRSSCIKRRLNSDDSGKKVRVESVDDNCEPPLEKK